MSYATRAQWATYLLHKQAQRVATTLEGSRNTTLHAACCHLARYVQDGALTEAEVIEVMLPAALGCGLEADSSLATIRSGLRPWTSGSAWYPPLSGAPMPPPRTVTIGKGKAITLAADQRVSRVAPKWAEGPLPAIDGPAPELWTVFFPALRVSQGKGEMCSLEQVQAVLEQPEAWPEDGKDALPLWCFSALERDNRGRVRTGEGSNGKPVLREPEITLIYAVILDYDEETAFSLPWVHERMGHLGYLCHTSASHAIGKRERKPHGRGRVILPLARPITEAEYDDVAAYMVASKAIGKIGAVEVKSPRRAYYLPARAPGGYEQRAHFPGAWLDPDAILAAVATIDAHPAEEIHEVADLWDRLETVAGPGDTRKAKECSLNLQKILEGDPEWMGRIRLDAFRGQVQLDGVAMTDNNLVRIAHRVKDVYGFRPATGSVAEVVSVVGEDHQFHPVREFLEGLQWDGVPRLATWATRYLRPSSPQADIYARKWLISAVARVMQPGCKVDTVPVLVGSQGCRKSSVCKVLGGGWFRESTLDIGGKDGYSLLRGAWVYELAELESFGRREWSTIKAYLSATEDTYRPVYGRSEVTVPRQVSFVATTNDGTFLSDHTGSRRFWPISVGLIDVEGVEEVRDQLWAEALVCYRSGESWHLTAAEDDARADHAVVHEVADSWEDLILDYLSHCDSTTIGEVLEGIRVHVEARSVGAERRVARVLGAAGWTQQRTMRHGQRVRRWYAPEGWVVRPRSGFGGPPPGPWRE